jgi:acetyl esterase/lipase
MTPAMDYTVRKGVPFCVHDGETLSGNLYTPAGAGPFPAVVALHGGGWRLRTTDAFGHWGPYLARRGYALFDVDYRPVQGEKNRYPAAVHDARAAVQFLRGEARSLLVDPDRIALMGDSAGAHLAALVALAGDRKPFAADAAVSTRVKAVVGVYGVYDMLAQWQHDQLTRPRDHITEAWLGASPMETKQLYYEASPFTYTTRDSAGTSFLVVWGTADDIVDPATQSAPFVTALKQSGFYVRTLELPGAPHFWMWDPIDEPTSFTGFLAPRLLRFLAERL